MDPRALGTVISVRSARLPDDIAIVRQLFLAYAASLGFELGFQNFDEELGALPGKYAPPLGQLLLAWDGDQAIGCVALRPLEGGRSCEMKRLYVQPGYRAQRVGRRLAERICQEASAAGYQHICLDTLPSMATALRLYQTLGFGPVAAYVFNPLPGALFLGLDLPRETHPSQPTSAITSETVSSPSTVDTAMLAVTSSCATS